MKNKFFEIHESSHNTQKIINNYFFKKRSQAVPQRFKMNENKLKSHGAGTKNFLRHLKKFKTNK